LEAFIFAIAFSSSRFRFFSCSLVSFRRAGGGKAAGSAEGDGTSACSAPAACLDALAAARLASASCRILLASML